ncbi:hypothetical protein HN992_01630 [Candidatus Woesearchaeota archaeon]|jgi:hypothetical protein|nr:hypothetical protein [Candidatus Woesearchaeota archaeon]MBT3438627.1 hypothetical protein [Candidatus Woesearchaeota archaeon]MBT4058475.1 hypothetical protein [Candidatus Woesearchaeota archaeon]MBT4207312.1 hypothetical protein [Candidatus Woesearchaeota archaeon]MBT4730969.1 hypothetical protein [Candidatus Woesearchaeota archaeon]
MQKRDFTITVLLMLAAAIASTNLVSNPTGMQIQEPEEKPACSCEKSHIVYSDVVGLPMGYCKLIGQECDSESLACTTQLGCDYKCRILPDMASFEYMDFCQGE